MRSHAILSGILTLSWCATSMATVVPAHEVTATITADNHYAFFTGSDDGASLAFHGANEAGVAGDPGSYNWSVAETWSVQAIDDYLYIAGWSDNKSAQGVLAEFGVDGRRLLSGDASWVSYATGIDLGDGDAPPGIAELSAQIAIANEAGWSPIAIGQPNGAQPWGTIAGIAADARWMWHDTPGASDAFAGGAHGDEYIIFRAQVPEAGCLTLLGAGLFLFRWRPREGP